MSKESVLDCLVEFGLSRLEAEVYVFLLANRPMTAYGIGKQLGRPTANVYKAVDALSRRGAALIEDGDNRLCRAVPASEFLHHIGKAFHSRTEQAAAMLETLERQTDDERVYRLESASQVFERCVEMLETRCERVAVVDAFPRALDSILPSIRAAIRRKITVYVEAYEPVVLEGAKVVVAQVGKQVLKQWQSQQLNVIVDGRESIAALLNNDLTEVYQGLWTNSRYLSCMMHSGRLAEHTLIEMRNASGRGLTAILDEHPFLLTSNVPGQRELLVRNKRKSS